MLDPETAVDICRKAREILDEIVEKQCVALMKREGIVGTDKADPEPQESTRKYRRLGDARQPSKDSAGVPRVRPSASFHLSLKIKITPHTTRETLKLPSINVVVWPDVAPEAARLIRQYAKKRYPFHLHPSSLSFGSTFYRDKGYVTPSEAFGGYAEQLPVAPPVDLAKFHEEKGTLWATPGSVSVNFQEGELVVTLLDDNAAVLGGKDPQVVFGEKCKYGTVGGKVVDGPMEFLAQYTQYDLIVENYFGHQETRIPELKYRKSEFCSCTMFVCDA